MQTGLALLGVAVCVAALTMSTPANAGGYEYHGDGARSLGRGGAFTAKADDPMAIAANPAALGSLPGTQFWVGTHLSWTDSCFHRGVGQTDPEQTSYDPGWGLNANNTRIGYPEVCNSERFQFIPAIAVTWRANKMVGLGFGIIPPNANNGTQRWGDQTRELTVNGATSPNREFIGAINGPPGAQIPGPNLSPGLDGIVPADGKLPAPGRYLLMDRDVVTFYPTFAIGIKPFEWFQFGTALSWGFSRASYNTTVRTLIPGEEPAPFEGQSEFKGTDFFVPRVSIALHFIPHDNVDIVGVYRWDDDVVLRGDVTSAIPLVDDNPDGGAGDGMVNNLRGTGTLRAPRPWWATIAIRYADRIVPRSTDPMTSKDSNGRVQDSMATERWDIELDLTYENSSQVDNQTVTINGLVAERGFLLDPDGEPLPPIDTTIRFGHFWQDQLSIRLGGDWNILPAVLAVRAGFSYVSSGLRDKLGFGGTSGGGTLDFFPLQTFGLHLGGTWRIRSYELSFAYTRFWSTTTTVTNGRVTQIVVDPRTGAQLTAEQGATIANNGSFSQSADVISIAFRYFIK